METEIKHFLAYISETKEAVNEQNRSIRFVISTEEVDRDREIITTEAIAGAIKDFSKNPVCLACHQHRLDNGMPPVVGSWNTESFKTSGKRSEMDLVFADTELGETYWKLYKNKHMRAVSIGFRILDAFEEMRNSVRVFIITKIELYEISCVPVGANRQALSKLKELGFPVGEQDEQNEQKGSDTSALQRMVDMAFERCVKRVFDGEFGKFRNELAKDIKDFLAEQFGELKDILIPDSYGLAEGDGLGEPSETDDSGGTGTKAGILSTLTQILEKLNK